MKYAGFWPRLGAGAIDALTFTPIMWLSAQLIGDSRMAHVYVEFPIHLALVVFNLWLIYRFGGSIGKLAMGLRIRMLDGSPITMRSTALRQSVDLLLMLAGMVSTTIAVQSLTDAQFVGLGWLDQAELIDESGPAWDGPLMILAGVWYWGELVVMLTNKKRRALHDFLAGTVVIKLTRERALVQEPLVAE